MKKILFITLLFPVFANAQFVLNDSMFVTAKTGFPRNINRWFLPHASGTVNQIAIHNGSIWAAQPQSALQSSVNYWVKDGSNNLSYTGGQTVLYNSNLYPGPKMGVSGINSPAIISWNGRTLTNGSSVSYMTWNLGPSYQTATDRSWEAYSLYDGTNANLRFQNWNGSAFTLNATLWASGRTTFGPTGSTDAGYTLQVNGTTLLGNTVAPVTTAVLRLQANTVGASIFTTAADPNALVTGSIGDLTLAQFGTFGYLYGKYSGSTTSTGWGKFLNLIDPNTATTGQYLKWDGSSWVPATLSPQSFTDAAAANNTIFYSTDRSKLCYKDPGGTVNELY